MYVRTYVCIYMCVSCVCACVRVHEYRVKEKRGEGGRGRVNYAKDQIFCNFLNLMKGVVHPPIQGTGHEND